MYALGVNGKMISHIRDVVYSSIMNHKLTHYCVPTSYEKNVSGDWRSKSRRRRMPGKKKRRLAFKEWAAELEGRIREFQELNG